MDRKKIVGSIFILFLIGSWLAGSMMNFQFKSGEGGGIDLAFIGPFVTVLLFAIPVFIFWRARTRIFFLLFSAALFFIILPVFFQALRALIIGLTLAGFILIFLAFRKGYISKLKAGALFGVTGGLGGTIFYLFMRAPAGRSGTYDDSGEWLPYLWPFGEDGTVIGEVGRPGLFMLILISMFGLGFFLYQKFELYRLFDLRDKEEEISMESDISSTVDKAISDLHEGKDIKETIMRCYQRMSTILEEEGIKNEDYMTPREFEKAANENLDVPTSKISSIREIFELAKYSSHILEEREKERVVEDLEALRDELK
ncbi:MAG: DUF4129 domain-containing protein [Candidatus Thermoplasmatota archaeon]|nr:DUF4129 domain-containing protein [Candidatus Thermoplasmatota archaeon]MBS3790451.1 DUF4129 domain-containing protein [Candidatus Thermoplasmatota archaeon]